MVSRSWGLFRPGLLRKNLAFLADQSAGYTDTEMEVHAKKLNIGIVQSDEPALWGETDYT